MTALALAAALVALAVRAPRARPPLSSRSFERFAAKVDALEARRGS